MNSDQKEVLDILADSENGKEQDIAPDSVVLSTGVVIRIKKVPIQFFRMQINKIKKPHPPSIYIESQNRHEENPNDPDYIEAYEAYENGLFDKSINLLLGLGTDVESLPNGFYGPGDDRWIEELKMYDEELEIDSRPKPRYWLWLQFWAAPSQEDLSGLLNAVRAKMGVTQEEVEQALDTFPGDAQRAEDTVGEGQTDDQDGD
jgi:hypothetical protein